MADDCRAAGGCDTHHHEERPQESNLLSKVAQTKASRRAFIKGVIASGAAMGASGYLFRAGEAQAQARVPGAVERLVSLKRLVAEEAAIEQEQRERTKDADRHPRHHRIP